MSEKKTENIAILLLQSVLVGFTVSAGSALFLIALSFVVTKLFLHI